MSRHHITPPAIYTPPPPKPKETKRRRNVGSSFGADAASETDQPGDVATPAKARAASPLPHHQTPIEATERRTHSPNGNLSDGTLKALLEVQEMEGEDSAGGASSTIK